MLQIPLNIIKIFIYTRGHSKRIMRDYKTCFRLQYKITFSLRNKYKINKKIKFFFFFFFFFIIIYYKAHLLFCSMGVEVFSFECLFNIEKFFVKCYPENYAKINI